MSLKTRRDLIRELTEAIGKVEDALREDPAHRQLLDRFRAFAAEHEIDLSLVDKVSGPSRSPASPEVRKRQAASRIPELLRLIDELESRRHGPPDDDRARRKAELAQAKETLAALRRQERVIHHGIGPYKDAARREQAQRALRDLPSRIEELERELESM